MNRRADIDGLRGVAILLVVVYHAKFALFPAGFIGVDVFLVVSGFLITDQLVRQIDGNRFDYLAFLQRRARRLAPAGAVMIAATLAASLFILSPRDLRTLAGSCLAAISIGSNVYFWGRQGYFAEHIPEQPLLHTWSLGLEEQFYLVFPAALWVACRFTRRIRSWAFVAVAGVSFALSLWMTGRHPGAAFYLLPTRAWEFLLGGLIALRAPAMTPRGVARDVAASAGLLVIVASSMLLTPVTPYPGLAALLPAAATAVVLWANAGESTGMARLLESRGPATLGAASYSIYLWHWPVLTLAGYYLGKGLHPVETGAALMLVLLLSWISWRYVERPFRSDGTSVTSPSSKLAVKAVALGIVAVSVAVLFADGFPGRLPATALSLDRAGDGGASTGPGCPHDATELVDAREICSIARSPVATTNILLWGDSHANAIAPAMAALGAEHSVNVRQASLSSCPPLLGTGIAHMPAGHRCREFNKMVLQFVRDGRVNRVVLAAYWSAYLPRSAEPALPRLLNPYGHADDLGGAEEAVNQRNFLAALHRTVDALRALGVEVWIVRQVPEQGLYVPWMLSRAAILGNDYSAMGVPLSEYRLGQDSIDAAFARLGGGIGLIDLAPALCASGTCLASKAGQSLYIDSHHLSMTGATAIQGRLQPAFH